jgi:hypothetical protein
MTNASNLLPRLRRLLGDVRTAIAMPRVDIVASRGEASEDRVLEYLGGAHPRYKIVGNKVIGASLLPLDDFDDVDEYLADRRYARRRVRRASKLGYTIAPFDVEDRQSELLAIHKSLPERQGQPIRAAYLESEVVRDPNLNLESIGVFHDDVLVAYSELMYAGEVVTMNRVMGHGDHLDQGVMFLLMAGIVEHVKKNRPEIRYVFYDMFFGAADGLRYFKTQLGFHPHYVRWKREPKPLPSRTADG